MGRKRDPNPDVLLITVYSLSLNCPQDRDYKKTLSLKNQHKW